MFLELDESLIYTQCKMESSQIDPVQACKIDQMHSWGMNYGWHYNEFIEKQGGILFIICMLIYPSFL